MDYFALLLDGQPAVVVGHGPVRFVEVDFPPQHLAVYNVRKENHLTAASPLQQGAPTTTAGWRTWSGGWTGAFSSATGAIWSIWTMCVGARTGRSCCPSGGDVEGQHSSQPGHGRLIPHPKTADSKRSCNL